MNENGMERPTVVSFTGMMMFIIAGVSAVQAIAGFTDNVWSLQSEGGLGTNDLWVWGIVDAVIAVVIATAAYDVLRGGRYGRIVGLVVVTIVAVRWLFWLPAAPVLGAAMLTIATVMLYALTAWPAYFGMPNPD